MYSFEQKEKIIEMLKNGLSIRELYKQYNIPKKILRKWKKETSVRKKTNELLSNNKLKEAKKQVEKLNGENTEPIKYSILIEIARKEGNQAEEKRLLEGMLEVQPNDEATILDLITIARKESNIVEEKKLWAKLLELKPDSIKTIGKLITIARKEGDIEEQKRLLQRILEVDPNNVIAIRSLTRIAREEGDIKEQKRLLQRQLDLDPNNVIAIRSLIIIARKEGNMVEEKRLLQTQLELEANEKGIGETENKKKELTPLEEARRLIYESENIIKGAEEIKVLIEKENQTNSNLILAELYFKTGMAEKGEKLLKSYKKTLDRNTQLKDIKIVNQAIELLRAKNTKRYKWNELWATKQKTEKTSINSNALIENKKTVLDTPGEDESR